MVISLISAKLSRNWAVRLFTLLILGVCFGCQQSTEPSDIVVGEGFDVTVRVHDQAGQPVGGVIVQWVILGEKQATFKTMPQAGNDGEFTATIPVPVATDSALVVVRTDIPTGLAGAEFKGNQKNGDFRLDTLRICGDSVIDITLLRQVTISNCGNLSCTPISLIGELPDKISDSSCTPEYVNSTNETLMLSPITPTAPFVTAKVRVNGAIAAGTAVIPNGASFQICYYFNPSVDARVERNQFTENIVASSPTNPSCLSCTFTLTTEVRRREDCDCPISPKPITFPTDTSKSVEVCIGSDSTVEIPIGFKNDNRLAGCDIEFNLVSPTSNSEFEVLSANNGQANTVRISPGASFGKLSVSFSPTVVRKYPIDIRYGMKVIHTDGTVKQCPDQLVIRFNGEGGQSTCRIDTASSSVFISPAKKVLDTLKNCVDVDLASNARTLKVINTGKCEIDVSASFSNSIFTVSPSSKLLQAGDTATFTLKFLPKPTDVWNGGRGTKPGNIRLSGTLSIKGCVVQDYIIRGLADTACNYSLFQCMHKWSEPRGNWNEVIQMDRSNNTITYKNNPAIVTDRDVFIDNITVASLTATLNSDVAHWKKVASRPSASPGETACNFGAQYINACDPSAPTGPLPVQLWDVISFTLDYADGRQFCGIIWITDIRNDVQGANGIPIVCIQICYPL